MGPGSRGAGSRPADGGESVRLLDLFCGAGGAAMGYHRAGFDQIVGVDIKPQPRYPFEFVQMDALEYAEKFGRDFDALHASPPCQKYSWSAKRWRAIERADLVPDTRRILRWIGEPFVIENVVGAPLIRPVTLCGTQFGLRVIRHRLFESSVVLFAPGGPCLHSGSVGKGDYITVAGHGGDNAKGHGGRAAKQAAMGIDWMNDVELNEAIPPAYTEFIGRQLLSALEAVA
jgi:DNA (cytosine-5)-methyltransferase 1